MSTVDKMRKELPALLLMAELSAHGLIRFVVTYMVKKIHDKRPVDTFILLLDEARRMEGHIVDCFPSGGKDITCMLRGAVLNSDVTFDGGSLKLCLAISSLSVSPVLSKLE